MQRRHLIILGVASALALSTGAQAKPEMTVDAAPGVNFSTLQDVFVGQDQSDRRI